MKALLVFLVVVWTLLSGCNATYEGCYRENLRSRELAISPGTYNPEQMTSTICRTKCGLYRWTYAGVAHGKFCFCGNILPALKHLDTNCNIPCAGNGAENCGSYHHVGVYTSIIAISGFQVASDVTGIQAVSTTVTLTVGVKNGPDISYQVDYGDGGGYTGQNETGFETRQLYLPGKHSINVLASNSGGTATQAIGVELTEAPADVEVLCDPLLVTFEEGRCEVTVWRGSDLTLDVSVTGKSYADVTAVPIAAPEQSLIGQWSQVSTATAYPATNAIYLLQEVVFPRQGRVPWIRVHAKTTGDFDLLVLSPVCGSSYCYESNSCKASCFNSAGTTLSYRCSASDSFCSGKTTCDATCAALPARFGTTSTLADQYSVKSKTRLTLSVTGPVLSTLTTPLQVEAGDILGIEYTTALGGQITLLPAGSSPDILITPYATGTVGTTYARTAGSSMGYRHALQAMFTAGSKTVLKYTLNGPPGTFPINAVVTNTVLGSTASGSSSLFLVEGVDQAIIDGPIFVVKDQATTWNLLTHTGSNLTYEWNITDGSPTVYTNSLTHTFTTVGDYNISVAIYNPLSRKENFTTISVLELVANLSIYGPPSEVNTLVNITVTMTTGTLVTCEVDYGGGSGIATISPVTAIPPSFIVSHTYTWAISFSVSINCSNAVNHQVATTTIDVASPISNLRLEQTGAVEGQTFALVWLLDTGTVDVHSVMFNGMSYALDPAASSDAALRWSSAVLGPLPVGGYPYNITLSNALGFLNITGYFSVMQPIVNPTLTVDMNDVTTDDTVTFQVDVTSGSDVTVVVQYLDGSTNDIFNPATPGDPWAGVMTFTHQFISGCSCSVKATFSNAATSEERTVVITVKVGFSQIDWDLSLPEAFYLYEPPAIVNFQFSSPTNIQPTDPKVLIDWGDGAPVETYNSIMFGPPGYTRQYDDTGDYAISISMSNAFTQKNYTHLVKVIEKLQVASIESDFPKAPLNLPFNIYFVMYRGDRLLRTNLTWDLGDGSAPFTTQRQGEGKNGRDPMTVTYTTSGTKTVTVQATAPLGQSLSATRNFEMILGVDPSSVSVTATPAAQLGQPTSFTVTYNSSPVPATASISIDIDADGTPDFTTPVTSIAFSGDSQTVTFTYTSDGIHNAIATLHNDACSVSVPISLGVYQSLTGMAVALTFEQNIPPGRPYDQNGLQNAGLKYPPDMPVKFYVTVSNNAYVSLYTVTVTSGPVSFVHTSTTNNFPVPFSVEGTYVLDIKAENPLFSANIPRTIQIQKRLKGLEINVSNEVLIPGEPTLFTIWMTDFTTGTCVYIDWDYFGEKVVYSDLGATCNHPDFTDAVYTGTVAELAAERLMYNYRAPGEYTVKIVAVDTNGDIETANRTLAISYDPCTRPTTSIQDSRSFFYLASTYERSRYIRLRGFARINCPANLANVKSWNLYNVDEETGQDVSAVDISSLTTTKAELFIPSRFLPLGTYKATYEMLMTAGAGVPFAGQALTYFQVMPSELLGVLVEGGMTFITVGTAQDYILEPLKYSLDPDVDPTDPQGLSVVGWDCSMVDGSTPDDACIAHRSSSSSTLTVQGSTLTEGQTYVITVTLQKGNRSTSAQLQIMINGLTSPISTITCLPGTVCYRRSDGYTALETSRISLRCNCLTCLPTASYQWTISIQDYRWHGGWRPLKSTDMMEDRSINSNGLNSQDLALEPGLFETFGTNSDVFKARCDINNGASNSTLYTNVWLNKPPKGGNCSVEPAVATATASLQKQWTVVCQGWEDSDGIREFHLYSYFDATEVLKEIDSFPVSGTRHVGLEEKIILPVGPAYRDYTQDIYLTVRDSVNSEKTAKIGTVQVFPSQAKELDEYIGNILGDPTANFFMDLEVGDQRTVTEKISAVSSMMTGMALEARGAYKTCTVASNWITTGYGKYDQDRPTPFRKVEGECDATMQYDADRMRNERSQLRSKLAQAAQTLSFEDTWSIQNVAGMLSQVVAEPTEVANDTQTLILDMLTTMISSLQDKDRMMYTPQEGIEEAMGSIYSVLGGVQAAAGITGNFPSLDDLDNAQHNPVWKDFDASPYSEHTEMDVTNAQSYEEAMKLHSMHVHKQLNSVNAANIATRVDEVKRKLAQLFNSFAIPGQELLLASYRGRGQLKKDFVSKFLGQTVQVSQTTAAVEMPSELRHLFPDQWISNETLVVLQVQENTNFPDVYSDYATARLNSFTHFVSVDIVDQEGQSIEVRDTATPIKISIPHEEKCPQPENNLIENPLVTSWDRFLFHKTSVKESGTSLHVQFELDPSVQLLVVARHGEVPNPEGDKIDHIFLVPPVLPIQPDAINPYTITLTSADIGTKVGDWWLGVRERNGSYINYPIPNNRQIEDRYKHGEILFEHNYKIKMWSSGCYFYDTSTSDWSADGCTVSQESTSEKTVCLCNHLTTFTGGFVVVPNTIDWNYVFSNADFLSNPTLYITEIIIFIAFSIGFFLARRKDKLDTQQVGLAPLEDNRKEDKYFYEIQVSTGMRRGAGTDSNVYFILSGEDDETEVRMFTDSKRSIFKKGMTNGFLMAVPQSLGRINYLRVWHDNTGSGPFASWFLNCIALRDLQTDSRQIFIANRWLALEEDDGQIDRIIPLAGKEQLEDFSYHFAERSRKDFVDGHLWFSVVARPPSSRFTCVQRVACCLCLLFMTMLTNAMFYNTQGSTSTSSTTSFNFGPFSLSPAQLFIGFVSTLIVFPVNFLLVFLFRRSKPRHKRSSPVAEAFRATSPDLNDKPTKSKKSKVGTQSNPDFRDGKTSPAASEAPSTTASMVHLTQKEEKKGKTMQLSWWWVIIAWLILIICTLGSAALVTFYGISFGDEQSKKWITSLIMSFFTSVFITQPLKVILTALLLSLIFRDSGDDEEGDDADDILQDAAQLEILHDTQNPAVVKAKPKKCAYTPPTEEQLETIRKHRLKEVRMWAVIREILAYCIFISILLILCHRNRGPDNFWYKDTMYRTFIKSQDTEMNFEKIKYTTDFWKWARTGLLNGLIAGKYYNAYPPLRLRTYINDKTSRILGYATLRQLRVYPGQCVVPSYFRGIVAECNEVYTQDDGDDRSFDVSWKPLTGSTTSNITTSARPEYSYTSADDLNSYPFWGRLGIYSGGGYIVRMNGTKEELYQLFSQLEREQWIDRYTRAVFAEFSVYNPQVNLFSVNMMLAEFHTTNGIVPSYRFEPALLLPYSGGAAVIQVLLEIIFLLFIVAFCVREMFHVFKQKAQYLTDFWNWIEMSIISFSIAAMVAYFYKLIEVKDLIKEIKETDGYGYTKLQFVGYWNEIFAYMMGFTVFLATLKFLKLLRFNRRVSMLANTLRLSGRHLLHFSIIFLIVFLAFCQLFWLTFMTADETYSSFIKSTVASILMMMGKFNIYTLIQAKPILTQIFVLFYLVSVTFIIVNMFVSILNDTFSEVRNDANNNSNEYEILQFMMGRFMNWTGIQDAPQGTTLEGKSVKGVERFLEDESKRKKDANNPVPQVTWLDPPDPGMAVFPSRIDQLLQSLSTIYQNDVDDAKGETAVGKATLSMWNKTPYQAPPRADRSHSVLQSRVNNIRRASLARIDN